MLHQISQRASRTKFFLARQAKQDSLAHMIVDDSDRCMYITRQKPIVSAFYMAVWKHVNSPEIFQVLPGYAVHFLGVADKAGEIGTGVA